MKNTLKSLDVESTVKPDDKAAAANCIEKTKQFKEQLQAVGTPLMEKAEQLFKKKFAQAFTSKENIDSLVSQREVVPSQKYTLTQLELMGCFDPFDNLLPSSPVDIDLDKMRKEARAFITEETPDKDLIVLASALSVVGSEVVEELGADVDELIDAMSKSDESAMINVIEKWEALTYIFGCSEEMQMYIRDVAGLPNLKSDFSLSA